MRHTFKNGDMFLFIQEQWVGDRHDMCRLVGEIVRTEEISGRIDESKKYIKIGFIDKGNMQYTPTLSVHKMELPDGHSTEYVYVEYYVYRFMLRACDCNKGVDE